METAQIHISLLDSHLLELVLLLVTRGVDVSVEHPDDVRGVSQRDSLLQQQLPCRVGWTGQTLAWTLPVEIEMKF